MYEVVIPTVGRPSLRTLVARLAELGVPSERLRIVEDDGPRSGPAAARNRGWRASTAEWVVFLDDDVVPGSDWRERLEADCDTLRHRLDDALAIARSWVS